MLMRSVTIDKQLGALQRKAEKILILLRFIQYGLTAKMATHTQNREKSLLNSAAPCIH